MRWVFGTRALRRICRRHGEGAAGETNVMRSFMILALHESCDVRQGGMRRA